MTDDEDPRPELDGSGGDPALNRPNAARMYDYYLGGAQNLELDREYAERALRRFPHAARTAQANRDFLGRAVTFCLRSGIRQFLDLGSGIPTVGSVHEVAHSVDPDARVAYVDNEPVAVAHSHRLLEATPAVSSSHADLRDPARVLAAPGVRDLLDFDQPVAVLMVAVLHFVSDTDAPVEIVADYCQALPTGSALVLSHVSDDQPTEELAAPHRAVAEVYRDTTTPAYLRDRPTIRSLFGEAGLVEPGLVDVLHWRPERLHDPFDHCGFYAGVGVL